MTLRARALTWLRGSDISAHSHVVTSKRYRPEESWTAAKAWWVQVPLEAIDAGKTIHIVCQAEIDSDAFRHLVVPADFFRANAESFALLGGSKINLFLSAEEESEFQDQRGPGRVSFAAFERRPER